MTGHMRFTKKQVLHVGIILCAQPSLWAAGDENHNVMRAETPAAPSQPAPVAVPPPVGAEARVTDGLFPESEGVVALPAPSAEKLNSPRSSRSGESVLPSEEEVEQHSPLHKHSIKQPQISALEHYPAASEFIDHSTFFRPWFPIRLYVDLSPEIKKVERPETVKLPRLNTIGFILYTFGVEYNLIKPKKRVIKRRVVYIGNVKCVLQEYEEEDKIQ